MMATLGGRSACLPQAHGLQIFLRVDPTVLPVDADINDSWYQAPI